MKQKLRKSVNTMPDIEKSEYPYGLRLSLDKDQLKKLGISVKDYEIGDTVTIEAKAKVESLSSSSGSSGDYETVCLQITDLSLD